MNKFAELPLVAQLYRPYHSWIITACLGYNPSIYNWFLSDLTILICNRKFLSRFTTSQICVENYLLENVFLETKWISIIYVLHNMKQHDFVLPIIKKKHLNLADKEKELLTLLVDIARKEFENETVEVYQK